MVALASSVQPPHKYPLGRPPAATPSRIEDLPMASRGTIAHLLLPLPVGERTYYLRPGEPYLLLLPLPPEERTHHWRPGEPDPFYSCHSFQERGPITGVQGNHIPPTPATACRGEDLLLASRGTIALLHLPLPVGERTYR